MEPNFLELAGIFGALAVALGAFGSHALRARMPADQIRTFETGVFQYPKLDKLAHFVVDCSAR